MKPTMKLRFVIRGDDYRAGKTEHGDVVELHDVKILQQWWKGNENEHPYLKGEWRDVGIEDEVN